MEETTTIQISGDLWNFLNQRKKRGDTFNDVIERLIFLYEKGEEKDDTS